MKQIELKLKKNILIIESESGNYAYDYRVDEEGPHPIKFICKGSELTEDIAKGLVEYDHIFEAYQYYQDTVPILGDTALNLFKTAIINNGYYWDKPLKEWFYHKRYVGVERIEESFDYEKWQEAESRTFNPDKCIIFEIL
ncbi:hypothetical protein JOE44_001955 [Chryseobacterium sp. PvR013]|uniref:hypothetical protein n=1 Tax=Chryseobacterium sp. PvR013 TaxID=2806595 RepID=UPI001AE42E0F|nr:hypothetical protein [Chryseobacterium sp. PvR013]MBP1165071.1 hypothetical protein [Chryseobacterium sp. PvR013]